MIRKISKLFALVLLFAIPSSAFASKTTYIYTNHRLHYVKRVELDKKELKKRGEVNHPYTFTELQLRNLLASIQFSKTLILAKEVEENEVLNNMALDFLVPHLAEAFKGVQAREEVAFSLVTYQKRAVFQDNRLTIATAWVKDNFLHIHFHKLMAKVDTTNYDKFSDVSKAINRARGVRVALELQSGQEFGESTDEILLPVAMADLLVKAEAKREEPKEEQKKSETPMAKTEGEPSAVESRLQQLEELKKKGLVSKKEYEEKKKEILSDL